MTLTILHISDLHLHKKKLHDIHIIRDRLFVDLDLMKKKENLNFDCIIFSGDIINKGQDFKEDFPLSHKEFIKPLLEHLEITQDEIFIVPGNHDVDRKKTSKNFEDGLMSNLSAQEQFDNFFDSFGENKGEESFLKRKLDGYFSFQARYMKNSNLIFNNFFSDVYKTNFGKLSVGILALNSVWRSSEFGNDKERLIIGLKTIETAIEYIKDCDLKIAISHHPLSMLTDWDQKSVKNSLARSVNILFTGHLHESDFVYEKPILGKLYISTSAAIFQGRIKNGYSIVKMDLSNKKLTVFLRRWYEKRREFDQETEKCAEGKIEYDDFKLDNSLTNQLIEISNIKSELIKNTNVDENLLVPIEDLSVRINDVFVEPMLSDSSIYDKSNLTRKIYKLKEILAKGNNVIIYGRKEFGKTTLLSYIGDYILRDENDYENKLPVALNFSEFPNNNFKSIARLILTKMHSKCTAEYVEQCLDKGLFVIMIDDFDSPTISDCEKKRKCYNDFYVKYPRCQYILTINETIAMFYNNNYNNLIKQLNASYYYLLSFNTTKIRELLKKWSYYKNFNINEMLTNILFFFQQLQVPVTPMNITLFIGVLFRDKNRKNIKNEAYLIENYLETILEKLQDSKVDYEFDFREKESFLAHIAYILVQKEQLELSNEDFKEECQKYFEFLDEDSPDEYFYEDFFKKGIFQKVEGKIRFKFKFWFHFFIAKAMQNNIEYKNVILEKIDFLKYATALAYKAGLDRNDIDLLNNIKNKLIQNIEPLARGNSHKKFNQFEIEDKLIEFSNELEAEIKEKNSSKEVDKRRDEKYLDYDDENQNIDEDGNDQELNLVELVTLYSDIIRNTREISAEQKRDHIRISIDSYIALMWEALEIFKGFIESLDNIDIKNFILNSKFSLKNKIEISDKELSKITLKIKEYIITVIPLSVILYMTDHLANNKLSRTINSLIDEEENINSQLFYCLLLLKMNFDSAISALKKIIKKSDSYIIDRIIFDFLIQHCLDNEVEEKEFLKIVEVLNNIREKYSKKSDDKKSTIYIKDTFISDIQAKINLIKFKKH